MKVKIFNHTSQKHDEVCSVLEYKINHGFNSHEHIIDIKYNIIFKNVDFSYYHGSALVMFENVGV